MSEHGIRSSWAHGNDTPHPDLWHGGSMAPDATPLTRDDIDRLAMALPEVTREGGAEHPAYAVRGRRFLLWRGPRKDAVDPATGERLPDVIAVVVPGPDDKQALLQSGPPWFTTPHFDGYDYVLVRERDLGMLDEPELAEIVADAWASRAPRSLVREFLG
ncbi:MmcQ/YjbR family DNA-binding protein [Fodinibacter luteus]|uniref:MmcQ/YjbR family DNA-binding protein n=1 Tax=Fodinibacter luteus TaxID=552064 RepID=A0ABP8KCM1_9MICO